MNTYVITQPDDTILELTLQDDGGLLRRRDPDGQYRELLVDNTELEQVAAELFANAVKAAMFDYMELASDYSEVAQAVVDHIGGARA